MIEKADKKSPFDYFIEVLCWVQIVASPFAISILIGGIVYFTRPGRTTLTIAIIIGITGLITGIIWATTVWRKKGTNNYLSRIMASPDLDKKSEPDE